jgi:predicted component of type VI protein secretion system
VRDPKQLAAIVAALHAEQEKRDINAAIDTCLAGLSWAPERIVEMLRPLRPNWRRHRPSLRLVLEYLQQQLDTQGSK